MSANIIYSIVIICTLASILFSKWTDRKFEKSVSKEYFDSEKDYFLEGGYLNYKRVLVDISEKKINKSEVLKYSKLKELSLWLMIFMTLVLMFVIVLKYLGKLQA